MNMNQTQETYIPDEFYLGKWLLKSNLSLGAKLTYSVLACCRNGRDYVWPSPDYLAQCVSASVRTVRRYMKELVDFGLIRIRKKYLMGQTRTIYIFLNHALVGFEPKASKAEKNTPVTPTKTVTKTAKKRDKNDTPYNKEESYLFENNISPLPPKKPKTRSRPNC